jgi:hypothetical protein
MDWIDLSQDRQVEGYCEHSNEPSGSKKLVILVCLSDWLRLKKGSAP